MTERAGWWRWVAGFSGLAASASVAVVISCADVGTTKYGDPSGLRASNLPGDGGTELVSCGDGGFGDAAGGGGCKVSFSKDIFPNMTADGPWKCASGGKCHGAQQAPIIDAGSPQAVIASLRDYHISGNANPYINQDGSTDPATSTFECNVTGACGNGMPIAPGTPLSGTDVCKIDAWLRCGAPNN